MSRFTRFSRISPLELQQELERRAWCCALPLFALFLLLAAGALFYPAPGYAGSGAEKAHFTGVPVKAVSTGQEETQDTAPIPLLPLPMVEPQAVAVFAVEVPQPLAVEAPEWEQIESDEAAPLLEYELPEHLEAPQRLRKAPAVRAGKSVKIAEAGGSEAGTPRGGGLIAARYRSNPHPPYPPSLLNRRVQGRVGLRIVVDAEGVPDEVDVVSSSGYAVFDRCAREWVRTHWRFHPARLGGVAVASVVRTHVDFVLG